MKKILALLLTFSISFGICCAQEAEDVNTAESENGKYLGFIKDMSAGAFFNFEPAAGELSEFVMSSIGGGVSFEAGIPLPFLENFGVSFRMTFDGGIMNDPIIDSLFSMRYTIGAYTKIPLPGNMFSIVPEIDYGLVFYFPEASGDVAKYLKNVYVDQILQLGAGIRFSHPVILNGNLEFEFTPTYSLSPESGSSVHHIGFRIGVLYKFTDKEHSLTDEENDSLSGSKTLEEHHLQLTQPLLEEKETLAKREEYIIEEFENLVQDAEENHIRKLAKEYKGYVKDVEKLFGEIQSVDSVSSLEAAEAKLNQLEEEVGHFEEIEKEAEVELDIAVTERATKTGHAALIHHLDGSYTIAIPALTFNPNSTGLENSEKNKKSLDTLIEVLTTDDRITGMTVSVFGFINPDSRSEFWTEEEKELAIGRAETIAEYLIENGCNHKVDFHVGEGYTTNAVFNRRVEFLVHS